jgi:hypothetical protein
VDHAFATYRGRLAANVKDGIMPGTKMAGKQACRLLYTGQSAQSVVDSTAGEYGASAGQAANLVSAARGTMCTQAPG